MRNIFFSFVICTFLFGCQTNNFEDYYNDEMVDKNSYNELLNSDNIKIKEVADINVWLEKYKKDGYIILGYSDFIEKWCPRAFLYDVAEDKNASLVLVNSVFDSSEPHYYTVSVPTGYTSTYNSGGIYGSGGYATYSGSGSSTSYRYETRVYYVKIYKQKAYFLAKKK